MNSHAFDSIYQDLTDEEKELLKKIEVKLKNVVEDIKEHRYDHLDTNDPNHVPDFSEQHPEVIHPTHVTIAPHEITFSIKAQVSEIDSDGYLGEIKDIVEKYYHVPVKAKDDWKLYMDKFFDKFHQSLENVCKELNKFKE